MTVAELMQECVTPPPEPSRSTREVAVTCPDGITRGVVAAEWNEDAVVLLLDQSEMADHAMQRALDRLARIIWAGLYQILPAAARENFKDERAPWRRSEVMNAVRGALPSLLNNIDLANALTAKETP